MDNREDVRAFLASRRARVTPEQAGIAPHGGRRRVPGLRREEVAALAGMSTDYYARMEKGNLSGVSDSVLDAVAGALRMDESEREHLFDLARASGRPRRNPRRRARAVRSSLVDVLTSMGSAPAFVRNGRLDVLAINDLGRALYEPLFSTATNQENLARFNFLDPASREVYPDWDAAAATSAGLLRTEAGRAPHDKELTDLIGELATRSEEFRMLWAAHDVRLHRSGQKHFQHPVVGRLDLDFNAMQLPADPGLTMTVYTAAVGTPSHDALQVLASWSASAPRFTTEGNSFTTEGNSFTTEGG